MTDTIGTIPFNQNLYCLSAQSVTVNINEQEQELSVVSEKKKNSYARKRAITVHVLDMDRGGPSESNRVKTMFQPSPISSLFFPKPVILSVLFPLSTHQVSYKLHDPVQQG